jgi:hypothetical protein
MPSAALDNAFLLQSVDSAPAGRLGDINLLGDTGGTGGGVVLQQAQYFDVLLVQANRQIILQKTNY